MNTSYTTYRKELSAMGHEAIRRKKANGELMHLAPFGYRNTRDAHGRSTLEPDPVTYPYVEKARELRATGMSVRAIAVELGRQGLRSRRGKSLSAMAVWRMISG